MKVHPDGTEAQKNGPQSIGKSKGGWTTQVHWVAADDRTAVGLMLSLGNDRKRLKALASLKAPCVLIMDRAYENEETKKLALDLGYFPVVPPQNNCIAPWGYDKILYNRRNKIERLFRRLKGFRRVFSRSDKLEKCIFGLCSYRLDRRGV